MARLQMSIKFDKDAEPQNYRFEYREESDGRIIGEVQTEDGSAKVSDLAGLRTGSPIAGHSATIISFNFELRRARRLESIFLAGRKFGLFFDGRFVVTASRQLDADSPEIFELGDTGTASGQQGTRLSAEEQGALEVELREAAESAARAEG